MNKLTPYIRAFIILFLAGHNVFAQSNIDVTHYTREYGMNYRWVYDITQDEHGFIWFANHTGLRRYDGEHYITYQHIEGDTASLSTNTIIRITNDRNGFIWAYGADGVFNKLELASGRINRVDYTFSDLNPDARMKDFGALRNGDNIALFYENGLHTLWRYSSSGNTFEKLLDLPEYAVALDYFTERSDGKLWLWGMGNGYYLADISEKEIKHYPVKGRDKSVSAPVDENGNFWYPSTDATGGNALLSFRLPPEIDRLKIERISLDNRDNIWFYHGDDVYRFDVTATRLEKFTDPVFKKSGRTQLMYHFFEDQDGGYWNGHFVGAIRFSKRQYLFDLYFNRESGSESMNTFNAREIMEMAPGRLLVRENEDDLYTLNLFNGEINRLGRNYRTGSGENISKSFFSLVLGRDGYLWTNQADRIIKTDIGNGTEEIFEVPLSPLATDSEEDAFKRYWPRIFEDASGNLWWCDPGRLGIFDRSTGQLQPLQVKTAPRDVKADFKYALYDPLEDVIYGTYQHGIYRVDCREKDVSLLEIFSGQESYDILITAVLYWKNEFWLSTNKGLVRFNPVTRERKEYTRKEGLPSSLVYNTLAGENHLWLATQDGLCQLDPNTNQLINYGMEQGLAFTQFNIWSAARTADGRMFFGGTNGIIGFNPDDFIMPEGKKGLLNLVGISTYNQDRDALESIQNLPYTLEDEIIIPASERTVTFSYVHTLYDGSSSNYFHMMEGLDSRWIDDGTQNEIRYTEIPPGEYVFRAKATGPNNTQALNEIAIPIEVRQYWYLRWWAVLIYLLLALTAVFLVYRMLLKRNLEKEEAIRIKELDEVKTKMYTNITHEFRTPLTVMLGMNEAVKDYAVEGETNKIFHANEMIERNGKNLLSLVNQMLELSKLEAGLLNIHNRQGNIVDYLKYRIESFQSYGEAKGVQIRFIPENGEIIMDYDVEKISYIVGNLVSNAIKFTPKGGVVTVEVRHTRNASGDPFFELKVKDTGIGIEEDKMELIFDRFYQADSSNVRKGEGTGIGLSLVKQLVLLLKGTIRVTSKVNEGSEFIVHIPVTNIAERLGAEPFPGAGEEWSESISGLPGEEADHLPEDPNIPLVLIVEDNADVSHYIKASLTDGYRTVQAGNGIDGIEMAVELVPDIIISDIMMPGKDGYELCVTLKKDERTSHIPIILLTGKADAESKIQGLEHGADVYLSKPFNRKELLIRLRNLMALRAEIQKHFSENGFAQPISGLSGTENAFLRKIRTLVLENMEDEEFNVTRLCDLVHLSRPQLHRKLVAITGESTSSLIRKVQLEKARELLASGELNVSEVAYRTGFKTQAHFSRIFSETLGMTPSAFMKK